MKTKTMFVVLLSFLALAIPSASLSLNEDPGGGGTQKWCYAGTVGQVSYMYATQNYSVYGHQRYQCRLDEGWQLYSNYYEAFFGNWAGAGHGPVRYYMWFPYDCLCYMP